MDTMGVMSARFPHLDVLEANEVLIWAHRKFLRNHHCTLWMSNCFRELKRPA